MIQGPRDMSAPGHTGMSLDSPPPLPPGATARPSLSQLTGRSESIGMDSANPQVQVLEGMKMIERGAQLLGSGLPNMAPQLSQLVMGLRQAVPQQLAESAGAGMGNAGGDVMPTNRPPAAI